MVGTPRKRRSAICASLSPSATSRSTSTSRAVRPAGYAGAAAGAAASLAATLAATPPRPSPPDYPAGLTAREVEVLQLVARGLSDAQVAERLFVSLPTVRTHLRSIYAKLDVPSRTAAARFAAEHGLT